MLELVGMNGNRIVLDPECAILMEECDEEVKEEPVPCCIVTLVNGHKAYFRDAPRHVVSSILAARKKAEPQYVNEFGHPNP